MPTPLPRPLSALVLAFLIGGPLHATPAPFRAGGVVFVDQNANGVRDTGEPGLGGVVVSNQVEVVKTAADGGFELSSPGFGVVFVSVPDGYRAVGSFWLAADTTAPGQPLFFAMAPVPEVTEFSFLHASDTHISPASVGRTQRFRAISDSLRPALVLITGDLIRDALRVPEPEARGYYDLFQREMSLFRMPVWTVPGNHELFGIERHLSLVSPKHPLYQRGMYRLYRGPDYYSFTYGGVHFVGLNTADNDDLWYYGHVDSVQAAWLAKDLEAIPASMPVVTFNHIPFYTAVETVNGYTEGGPAPSVITVRGRAVFRHSVSNSAELLAILRTRPYDLALGGHMHVREQLRFEGLPVRFYQGAAVIGPSQGPAGSTLASGVVLYTVRGGKIDDGKLIAF